MWGNDFFGIMDVKVQSLRLQRVAVHREGRSEARIPDFSKDAVTNERKAACLEVMVIGHDTGNLMSRFCPPGVPGSDSRVEDSARV
jgi:hypothetical protein